MEANIFMFCTVFAAVLFTIRFLRDGVGIHERAFLFVIIIALIYATYDEYLKYNLSVTRVKDEVRDVLSTLKGSFADMELKGITFSIPLQKVLESDPVMLKTVFALGKYVAYDKDVVYGILGKLVSFYELYADILMELKDVHTMLGSLIDIRMSLMAQMHSLFVSLPQAKHTKVFEHITLVMQSSTYKCLNVLKNKYGTTAHEPPVAENTFNSAFEMY